MILSVLYMYMLLALTPASQPFTYSRQIMGQPMGDNK